MGGEALKQLRAAALVSFLITGELWQNHVVE